LFADDTTTTVVSIRSIQHILSLFEQFGKASGAALNKDKSQGFWIGGIQKSSDAASCGINWGPMAKICGVYFGQNYENQNAKMVSGKLQTALNLSKQRGLTFAGKAELINICLSAKIWYIGACILLEKTFEVAVTRMFFRFLWKSTEWIRPFKGCKKQVGRRPGSVSGTGKISGTPLHAYSTPVVWTSRQMACFRRLLGRIELEEVETRHSIKLNSTFVLAHTLLRQGNHRLPGNVQC
jgi:hypothetical protein